MNNTISVTPWDDTETLEPPTEYLEFNAPPLALVIAMLENNKQFTDIVATLQGVNRNNVDIKTVVNEKHHTAAEQIYSYFSKKHTMRRLKGEFISKWMMAVEDLCDRRKRIDSNSLPVLVTLPKFYQENLQLEPLMRDYKSAPDNRGKGSVIEQFETQLAFVKKIERRAVNTRFDDYYWSTEDRHLVRVRLKAGNAGTAAWNYISKVSTINLNADYAKVVRMQGYDFNIIEPITIKEVTEL